MDVGWEMCGREFDITCVEGFPGEAPARGGAVRMQMTACIVGLGLEILSDPCTSLELQSWTDVQSRDVLQKVNGQEMTERISSEPRGVCCCMSWRNLEPSWNLNM